MNMVSRSLETLQVERQPLHYSSMMRSTPSESIAISTARRQCNTILTFPERIDASSQSCLLRLCRECPRQQQTPIHPHESAVPSICVAVRPSRRKASVCPQMVASLIDMQARTSCLQTIHQAC